MALAGAMHATAMTAIAITSPGGPEVLQAVRQSLPVPGPGEVLIRVAAAGLNAPDLAQRRGTYPPPPGASPLPGLEVSGEIVALAEGAAGFAPGDRVVALCNGGGYAEYVAVPAGQVLPLPPGWSLLAAAALPETFFTVQQTLVMRAGLRADMTVLVHGAAGGIGGAAIIISRLLGALPIAVVSSPEKAAYARRLGAAHGIDHTSEDIVARTLALTDKRGADRVVDIIGGDMLQKNIAASARGGHIVIVSTLSGAHSDINAGHILVKQLTLSGSTLRPQPSLVKAEIARSLRETVWPALASAPRPRILALPLASAPLGHATLERRSFFGKLVLVTPWGETAFDRRLDPDNPIEIS